MNFKIIPIITHGFSTRFFSIPIHGEDWSEKPHLQISSYMYASFALNMGDDGLTHLGIRQGDYLLFSLTSSLSNEQIILVCNEEEEYMIRESYMFNDTIEHQIPSSDGTNEEGMHKENIRIFAILDHVIKPCDDLKIVYFK